MPLFIQLPYLNLDRVENGVNDVVNIPITESMAKIQQIEQQQTQLAQERQVSQSQSQQHGISLA